MLPLPKVLHQPVFNDSDMEGEGEGEEGEEGGAEEGEEEGWRGETQEDAAAANAAKASATRVGLQMEIQGCDPDACDYVCTDCAWDTCTVEADYGRTCDVRITEDGFLCKGIIAHRFLRIPQGPGLTSRKKQRSGQ